MAPDPALSFVVGSDCHNVRSGRVPILNDQKTTMSCTVTSDVVVAYSQCPRKALFLLRGEPTGSQHEYERVLADRATANRSQYLAAVLSGRGLQNPESVRTVSANDLVATCDALVKAGPHRGKAHARYEPHLVAGTYSITKEQKLALAFAGYVTGQTGQHPPVNGLIVPYVGQPQRVRLQSLYPKVRTIIERLRGFTNDSPSEQPPLILNKNCSTCLYRNHCREEAEQTDSLTLLERMTPKLLQRYAKKGISTVSQLSCVYRPRRRRKRVAKQPLLFNVELQALAIRTNKVYLHETPTLAMQPVELFLDIEGIPDQAFHYLIGLLVRDGDVISHHSFWANASKDEAGIFQACLDLAANFPNAPIYHYGSYEPHALQHASKKHRLDCKAFIQRLVNVNSLIFGKVYFPTRSNRLKDLGTVVGASWSAPDSTGLQSVVWRYKWEDGHEDKYKDMLLAYNKEDCAALQLLTAEIQELAKSADSRSDVDFTSRRKKSSTPTGELIHKIFDGILKSAHAEYRRRRITLSIGDESENVVKEDRRHRSRPHPFDRRKIPKKANKTVHVPRKRTCPRHKGRRLQPTAEVVSHSMIDLKFTNNGCRKEIIKYVGKKAFCSSCNVAYLPPALLQMHSRIFGHAFQAWAVYQRVAMRLPYDGVSQVIEALFSEHVNNSTIRSFSKHFSKEYASSERSLLHRILESAVIHADETKINVQGSNQHVWVLTDGSHVIFKLTETREATVIQTLLRGYEGVLVSDFYGGYDAVACRQQKCLVHLIRDLNEDLWKNPFNREYESFVAAVRDLLVPIFRDVERYGLKARHLGKHKKAVNRFYRQCIDGTQWQCEIVQTYMKRFVRYRESLFLFLEEDGIPWNNNMAERALRHLAIQRKISGCFYKSGAVEYLRLLGIAQTCRFQGKSFLQFLLSGERDVDKFGKRRRRRG